MNIDFEKYKILRLQQRGFVNPTQHRVMGRNMLHATMEKTAESLRREIVQRFIRVEEVPGADVTEIQGDCFVVNYEDLLTMVRDAYAAGLRSKEYWGRYEVPSVMPTMED